MNSNNNQKNKPSQKQEKPLRKVALLSGLAIQMSVITGLGAYLGYQLDIKQTNEELIWTIVGTFVGFGIAMYLVVKQANKLSK